MLKRSLVSICSLPPELLNHVLDNEEIYTLSRCMRVCRSWYEVVVNHPVYWGDFTLQSPDARAARGLLARISWSHGRPVNVSISAGSNNEIPSAVILAIQQHLYHIRDLSIDASIRQLDEVMDALERPAPLLQSLTLRFGIVVGWKPLCSSLSRHLLSGNAPKLQHLAIFNIRIPPRPMECLAQVTELFYGTSHVMLLHEVMDDVPLGFPNLQRLTLRGRVACTPVRSQFSSSAPIAAWWSNLRLLTLQNHYTAAIHPVFLRPTFVQLEMDDLTAALRLLSTFMGSGTLDVRAGQDFVEIIDITQQRKIRFVSDDEIVTAALFLSAFKKSRHARRANFVG
ncbi:hypothetical protein BKA62DRAFT_701558 [Auriculariales sp. MPI-PUGE-AT-0066]|nr:hypothetical protein BKA62DRAFT_701558 [Auriculariales sp. MPI-PUGE-AT-0066]